MHTRVLRMYYNYYTSTNPRNRRSILLLRVSCPSITAHNEHNGGKYNKLDYYCVTYRVGPSCSINRVVKQHRHEPFPTVLGVDAVICQRNIAFYNIVILVHRVHD